MLVTIAAVALSLLAAASAPINVQALGARGDGKTDDTPAITKAIASATASHRELVFPAGDYLVHAGLKISSSIDIRGSGAANTIITFSDDATTGIDIAAAHSGRVELPAGVAGGSRTIALPSASTVRISAGSTVYIEDHRAHNGSFMTRVVSVSSDSVTLEESSPVTFAGPEAVMYYYAPGTGPLLVHISGIRIRIASNAIPKTLERPLVIRRADGAVVRDVEITGALRGGLTFVNCRGCVADHVSVETVGSLGNGIDIQNSVHVTVQSCRVARAPFGIVASASPYTRVVDSDVIGTAGTGSPGRGIKLQDGSNGSIVSRNHVGETGLYGIYISDSAFCGVSGNTIVNTGDQPMQHAIELGGYLADACHHNIVTGNVINGATGFGIAVVPTGGERVPTFNVITGNVIAGTNGGIVLDSSSNSVFGNTITGSRSSSIVIRGETAANVVHDNTITGPD